MNKPHKHAALIKAWADGAEIQLLRCSMEALSCRESKGWEDCPTPAWSPNAEYRIKPERQYPRSSLSENELYNLAFPRSIADAAVKRYIDDQEKK